MKKIIAATFITLSIFLLSSCNQTSEVIAPGETSNPSAISN